MVREVQEQQASGFCLALFLMRQDWCQVLVPLTILGVESHGAGGGSAVINPGEGFEIGTRTTGGHIRPGQANHWLTCRRNAALH